MCYSHVLFQSMLHHVVSSCFLKPLNFWGSKGICILESILVPVRVEHPLCGQAPWRVWEWVCWCSDRQGERWAPSSSSGKAAAHGTLWRHPPWNATFDFKFSRGRGPDWPLTLKDACCAKDRQCTVLCQYSQQNAAVPLTSLAPLDFLSSTPPSPHSPCSFLSVCI